MYVIVTEKESVANFARMSGEKVFVTEDVVESLRLKLNETKIKSSDQLMKALSIYPTMTGYKYIKYFLDNCLTDQGIKSDVFPITRKLYPMIATQYGTTPTAVEKAIRNVIGCSYARVPEMYESLYGHKLPRKPFNKGFLIFMGNYLIRK